MPLHGWNLNWLGPVNKLHPLNRNLVSWWLVVPGLTGGPALIDIADPNNGNHGTLTNMDSASDWVAGGRPGGWGALEHDGTDQYVLVGNPANLQLETGPITISVWGLDTAGGNSIITKGLSRGAIIDRGFDMFDTGSQFRFHGLKDSTAIFTVNTTTRPLLNVWHLYTATWDGTIGTGAAKLYIDGILAATNTPTDTSVNTGQDWAIGGNSEAGQDNNWIGFTDDTRIYNRALSADEIALLYRLSRQGSPELLNRIETPLFVAAPPAGFVHSQAVLIG